MLDTAGENCNDKYLNRCWAHLYRLSQYCTSCYSIIMKIIKNKQYEKLYWLLIRK